MPGAVGRALVDGVHHAILHVHVHVTVMKLTPLFEGSFWMDGDAYPERQLPTLSRAPS